MRDRFKLRAFHCPAPRLAQNFWSLGKNAMIGPNPKAAYSRSPGAAQFKQIAHTYNLGSKNIFSYLKIKLKISFTIIEISSDLWDITNSFSTVKFQ